MGAEDITTATRAYADEASFGSGSLYRVLQPGLNSWTRDGNFELQSRQFASYSESQVKLLAEPHRYPQPAFSVVCARTLAQHGEEPQRVLDDWADDHGIAELCVESIRENPGFGIMMDPRPSAPWHAIVFDLGGGSFTKGQKKHLKRCVTRILREPTKPFGGFDLLE